MLKIERTANGEVVFVIIGRLDAEGLRELSDLLAQESSQRAIILELRDLALADRDSVGFLRACERKGIELRNCPQYIRTWIGSAHEPG